MMGRVSPHPLNPLRGRGVVATAGCWAYSQSRRRRRQNVRVTSPRQAADGSQNDTTAGRWGIRAWLIPVNIVIAVATLLALGLRVYQLTGRAYLLGVTEYDDGSYLGSAIRLVNGALPYRDFVFVQPSGITLLMTPIALVTKVTGSTAWGMGIGRILTTIVSAAG